MDEEELVKYFADTGVLGAAVASEAYDDLLAKGLEKSVYSKYKAADLYNKANEIMGRPYKINLRYPEHLSGTEGFVARNWKAASPLIKNAIPYLGYYPTAKLYYNTLQTSLNSPIGEDFDRWVNGEPPIDRNML